ncbi:chorion class CB protein M5H4-like [Hyposmocoma kahamanoa]|uniref:chorion class CB protein M5H4-like n=1 Tax=Hyposmocoma kahamanoa TaxID=1477025 RepID=UPI000E6DA51F|nr:chorion class CB protein M5H4-like [Hyposmocoma kahamanoa]
MVARVFVILCASILLVKIVSIQCINSAPINFNTGCGSSFHGPNFPNSGLNGFSYSNAGNTYGGAFPISNNSPISPSGISIISENNIEGALVVTGQLPILAAVAVDGKLPTSGSVGTTYSCGNGNVGIDNIGGNYGGANLASAPMVASGSSGPRMGPGCGYGIY